MRTTETTLTPETNMYMEEPSHNALSKAEAHKLEPLAQLLLVFMFGVQEDRRFELQ